MTDYIDTRAGWREVTREEALRSKVPTLSYDGYVERRYWEADEGVVPMETDSEFEDRVRRETATEIIGFLSSKYPTLGRPGLPFVRLIEQIATNYGITQEDRRQRLARRLRAIALRNLRRWR